MPLAVNRQLGTFNQLSINQNASISDPKRVTLHVNYPKIICYYHSHKLKSVAIANV